jgi:hypothetical protein
MLPYTDKKPVGAADFYFAINATFRFIRRKLGPDGLVKYWTDLGASYFEPVTARWRDAGLPAVAGYWRDFFSAEPGGNVTVSESEEEVILDVGTCPAVAHLRAGRREIDPWFCRHCYFVSDAMARPAGMAVRISGGNGSCTQRFYRADPDVPAQDLDAITSCA